MYLAQRAAPYFKADNYETITIIGLLFPLLVVVDYNVLHIYMVDGTLVAGHHLLSSVGAHHDGGGPGGSGGADTTGPGGERAEAGESGRSGGDDGAGGCWGLRAPWSDGSGEVHLELGVGPGLLQVDVIGSIWGGDEAVHHNLAVLCPWYRGWLTTPSHTTYWGRWLVQLARSELENLLILIQLFQWSAYVQIFLLFVLENFFIQSLVNVQRSSKFWGKGRKIIKLLLTYDNIVLLDDIEQNNKVIFNSSSKILFDNI